MLWKAVRVWIHVDIVDDRVPYGLLLDSLILSAEHVFWLLLFCRAVENPSTCFATWALITCCGAFLPVKSSN